MSDMIDTENCTIPQLRKVFGKSIKSIRDDFDNGIIPVAVRGKRGDPHKFNTVDVFNAYIAREKANAKPAIDTEISDLKRRAALADAERKEYASAAIKRRMVSIDEVAEFLDDRNMELVQHLRRFDNGDAILMALHLYNRNLRSDLKLGDKKNG